VFPKEAFATGDGDVLVVHDYFPERTGFRIASGMAKREIATGLGASQ